MQQDEQLISFKVAMLAKEKGFDLYCKEFTLAYYNKKNGDQRPSKFSWIDLQPSYKESDWALAPTQGLLQKWLRELPTPIVVTPTTDFIAWEVEIQCPDRGEWKFISKDANGQYFDKYETALETGLIYALGLL